MAANPSNPAHRTRASRLRRAQQQGQALDPTDALWLASYDEAQKNGGHRMPFGASKKARTVKFELNEEAQAIGTGPAAEAAAAALMAKEEGRRLDSLTVNAVAALRTACDVYKDVCLSMKDRMEVLEGTHIAMLESVRAHFLARTDAEAELERAQQPQDTDIVNTMLMGLLQAHGILPPAPQAPPKNGASKKA